MPLILPNLSDRTYQELLSEAQARIPVHNPEWTNFNDSDPGITLIQLFAFMTENLLYRSNQIPERNRIKFLSLLGIPLLPGAPANGLATFTNEGGQFDTVTLSSNLEVRAGQVPFRTESGLDVLPVEWRVYYKKPIANPSAELLQVYKELYVSYARPGTDPTFSLYETALLGESTPPEGVNLAQDTVGSSLWIAILRRRNDRDRTLDQVRERIAGRTVTLALVPALDAEDLQRVLAPGQAASQSGASLLRFEIPSGGSLGASGSQRQARYRTLEPIINGDVYTGPALVQLTLPGKENLQLWDDIEPLEAGVGDLPPALDDTNLNDRLVTWIRVRLASGTDTSLGQAAGQTGLSLLRVELNTVRIRQRAHVSDELLPRGTGAPDQTVKLANTPVIADSVKMTVTANNQSDPWEEVDDLLAAGPEVYVPSPRLPPGVQPPKPAPSKVFHLDAESGEITFGDGLRGARPPFDAVLRAEYDYSAGRSGNVGAGAIKDGPDLPPGFQGVNNPVSTWGGADPETVTDGEKQITAYLQHHDRLVTAEDFRTLTERTPGVEVGRVEIIPAYHPDLAGSEPGDAPGAVTLMVIPKYDPLQPNAPRPDRLFLNTICAFLDPRRLVTTELILKGPTYKGIWVSVSIRLLPGVSMAEVTASVKKALQDFLSPLPPETAVSPAAASELTAFAPNGWPLRTPVIRLQLWAVASRVQGVLLVNDVQLGADSPTPTNTEQVEMKALELPRLLGISVTTGPVLPLSELRAQTLGAASDATGEAVLLPLPVPVIPETCQ